MEKHADAEKGKYTAPEGSKTWEYLAAFTCSIMAMCIGAIVGWSSPSLVKLMEPDSPIQATTSDLSTLVALIPLGKICGPLINRFIVDRAGRKNAVLLGGVSSIACWGLISIATNIWVLFVARFMGGVCLGMHLCVSSIYIGEIASPSTRGAAGSSFPIMLNVGLLLLYIIAPLLSISLNAVFWLTISVGFVVIFWFMPESPYFLVMKSRLDEAEAALEKLRGKTDVSEELLTIVSAISNNEEEQKRGGIKELLTVRANRRAFIILNLMSITKFIGGLFLTLTYGQLAFKAAQLQTVSEHTANIAIGAVSLISSIIISFLVDRLGRKPLILFSGIVAAMSNLAIALFFYVKDYLNVDVSAYSIVPVIAAVMLVFAFNCGLLPMQLVFSSEIFATEIKALANCLVTVINGIFTVIVAKTYLLVAVTWGYGFSVPYFGFFVVVAVCTTAVLRLVPETKGKTFVQIQKELND